MSKTAFTVALISASAMGAMSLQETKAAMLLNQSLSEQEQAEEWEKYRSFFNEWQKAAGGSLNLPEEIEGWDGTMEGWTG